MEPAAQAVTGREQKKTVRIHIDRRLNESPNPTTGSALYALGKVPDNFALYRETFGDDEDQLVPKGADNVRLVDGEHFYSVQHHEKGVTIVVNTIDKHVLQRRLAFEQVVTLAALTQGPAETVVYTVTYEKGPRHKPEGSLLPGESVKVRNGMIFDVTATNRS